VACSSFGGSQPIARRARARIGAHAAHFSCAPRGHDPCSNFEHHALSIVSGWGRRAKRVHARAGSYRSRARLSRTSAAPERRRRRRDGYRTRCDAGEHASARTPPAQRDHVRRKPRRQHRHGQRNQGTVLHTGERNAAPSGGTQRHAAARPTLGFGPDSSGDRTLPIANGCRSRRPVVLLSFRSGP
jgi:hypothetical protein